MRLLILTRGLPGCGKSTFLQTNLTEEQRTCVISADDIRLQYGCLKTNADGTKSIDQRNDRLVWEHIRKLVENRMKRGETTIIDATSYDIANIKSWKSLSQQYRYDVVVWDFFHPDEWEDPEYYLTLSRSRNIARYNFRTVPTDVLHTKMFPIMREQNNEFPNWIKRIPSKQIVNTFAYRPFDFNTYKDIYIFGDIHGCMIPLQKFFDENPFSDDALYIFTGDYLDRGLENRKVIEFLFTIKHKSNVKFLEGNHERHLRNWYNGENVVSREFVKNTTKDLEGIDRRELKDFLRRLGAFSYFEFRGQEYLVTHGGMTELPDIFTPEYDCIGGVGKYEDGTLVEETFMNAYPDVVQVHGHRNTEEWEFGWKNGCYRLEGRVEFGGDLRILHLTDEGQEIPLCYKNDYFKDPYSVDHILQELVYSDLVREKDMGDSVSSFNFTEKAFFTGKWNRLTTHARGLYIDKDAKKVVARSYEKFHGFEVEEGE